MNRDFRNLVLWSGGVLAGLFGATWAMMKHFDVFTAIDLLR